MPQTNLPKAQANAKHIGVSIKASTVKNKKLDVYKDGKKVASIGDIRYSDFLTTGDEDRRKNYLKRHEKTRMKVGSPSYYAWKILWS
tara:strand:+ start:183 stop:443 length:261 start_codon:yes stop_codon:yes gene_type:complete